MNAQELLARLQDASPDGPLDRLAALVVEHELSQPLETLLPPALGARARRAPLGGGPPPAPPAKEPPPPLDPLPRQLSQEKRPVRQALPPELPKPLSELAARRYSPDR